MSEQLRRPEEPETYIENKDIAETAAQAENSNFNIDVVKDVIQDASNEGKSKTEVAADIELTPPEGRENIGRELGAIASALVETPSVIDRQVEENNRVIQEQTLLAEREAENQE